MISPEREDKGGCHMAFIPWSEKLSVGVAEIDRDHQQLVAITNELHAALREGKAMAGLGAIFARLVDYTIAHFRHEELLMREHAYPAQVDHVREHSALTRKVRELQNKYQAGTDGAITLEVMEFLRIWLSTHIRETDAKFGKYLNTRGLT